MEDREFDHWYPHSDEIDQGIEPYIEKLNEFEFVETKLSCQGHYVKKATKVPFLYLEKIDRGFPVKALSDMVMKPIYVLMEINDKYIHKKIVRFIIRHRRVLAENNLRLYVFMKRNYGIGDGVISPCMVLGHFDRKYISLSLVSGISPRCRYEKHRLRMNKTIKFYRKYFFEWIIKLVEVAEKYWNEEEGH